MVFPRTLSWLAAGGLIIPAFGQMGATEAPVPADPLELVTGAIQNADTPQGRAAALQLLASARSNFALRRGGQAYDLKVSFSVNSGGATEYDGAWQMEET
ncbi:MAG TPA: hypothetical protein VKS01_00240, partial [Bryobacteraceae bacterium]|nr:hypothetical protein [Bryobacteraceae bacterium]